MNQEFSLKNFSGQLPLFPLPNVVHFPNTYLPLHVFEKRYRRLLSDALEGERLIGMAVLKPGWEENYAGNPEIYPTACLGTIIKHEPLSDGRSNILLLGLKRVRIRKIVRPLPYRTAQVEVMEESMDGISPADANHWQNRLLELYSDLVIELAGSKQTFPPLSNANLSLSALTDALTATLGFSAPQMAELLGEFRVLTRVETLLNKMKKMLAKSGHSLVKPASSPDLPLIHLN